MSSTMVMKGRRWYVLSAFRLMRPIRSRLAAASSAPSLSAPGTVPHLPMATWISSASWLPKSRWQCTVSKSKKNWKTAKIRFSKAFHSSPVGLSISNIEDGTFLDVNESFLQMFGYRREELIGQQAAGLNLYDNPL